MFFRCFSPILALSPLALGLLVVTPALSAEPDPPAPSTETDPLAMYFDESDLVTVTSGSSKPMIHVAENVTILRADEIEELHAQSLAEVLERVSGLSVTRTPADFNGGSDVYIQGSREVHVLVLIDGVRLNSAMSGNADLSHIPLRVIDRIEIIKGPASSVWGSSQGGVINIFTRTPASGKHHSGSVEAEYGEAGVAAYEADVIGKVDRFGYYLYAGRQDSDGLLDDHFYDSGRAYGKFTVDLPRKGLLTLTGMAVDPHYKTGDFDYSSPSFSENIRDRSHYVTANYDTALTDSLRLNLGARDYERNFIQNLDVLASSLEGDPGSLFWGADWHEEGQGGNALLSWQGSGQQVSVGGEINRNTMDSVTSYGAWAQDNWGTPAEDQSRPGFEEEWGVFANDTLHLGRLTLTPGVRYDEHSISGSLISPSLGATWLLRSDTLLRAVAARGFQNPVLSYIAGGGIWDNPNPELKAETVSSLQAGIESRGLPWVSVKADLFYHEVGDTWRWDDDDWNWKNGGDSVRKGIEAGLETASWHDLRLVANTTYTLTTPEDDQKEDDSTTAANLMLRYRDTNGWKGELAGNYVWWDMDKANGTGQDADLIWNLSLGRTVYSSANLTCDIYAKVYNLLDGKATPEAVYYPLPGRWLLAGMRMSF